MTVIAYHKGTMVSDRLHYLDVDGDIKNYNKKKKIYINEDNTLAFCITGIEVTEDSLKSIFLILLSIFELQERIIDVSTSTFWASESYDKTILQSNIRQYIAMTRNRAIFIDSNNIYQLDRNDILCRGSDGIYFNALASIGMNINDIIPHIHDNISRKVSREFDILEQSELDEIKFIETIVHGDRAIDKLKSKIKEDMDMSINNSIG